MRIFFLETSGEFFPGVVEDVHYIYIYTIYIYINTPYIYIYIYTIYIYILYMYGIVFMNYILYI